MSEEDRVKIVYNHYGAAVKQAWYYYSTHNEFRNKRFYSNNLDYDDFLQEALDGVIMSIDKYNFSHEKQATFNTYAHNWIRNKCQRYFQNNCSIIRMPIYKHGKEKYAYHFIEIDGCEEQYQNFLQGVNS